MNFFGLVDTSFRSRPNKQSVRPPVVSHYYCCGWWCTLTRLAGSPHIDRAIGICQPRREVARANNMSQRIVTAQVCMPVSYAVCSQAHTRVQRIDCVYYER
jgi:hypothetical protein